MATSNILDTLHGYPKYIGHPLFLKPGSAPAYGSLAISSAEAYPYSTNNAFGSSTKKNIIYCNVTDRQGLNSHTQRIATDKTSVKHGNCLRYGAHYSHFVYFLARRARLDILICCIFGHFDLPFPPGLPTISSRHS